MIDLTQLTIRDQLGAGSQGKVFLATDPEGARFTVKLVVVGERFNRNLIFERAWLFRADALDPSMIPILSHGMVSNTPPELARQLGKLSQDALVLVMPFVAGTTLADIEARGALTLQEGVAALAGTASALAKLPPGVVHGDLRAPNIFIRPSGEIALSDPDLSSNPDPADDVRALAAIGLNLAKIAPPVETRQAVEDLQALIAEIAVRGVLVTADEVALRLGNIAVLLGAPALKVTSVLAKHVPRSELESSGHAPVESIAGPGRRSGLIIALAALVLLGGVGWLIANRWQAGRPLNARRADDTGEINPESLYDHTGTVHYSGTVHQLRSNELVAEHDGFLQVTFASRIERLALLSARQEVLWEVRRPAAGTLVYLDVKPDYYYVEEDRALGDAGIQRDLRPVRIDKNNPRRIMTTPDIVSSPRRPGG